MNLAELAAACDATLRGGGDPTVGGITHLAQAVRPGWVFAAVPGQHHHGLEFVDQALSRGAIAVLSDRDPGPAVAWLASKRPRRGAALAAWALAGRPDRLLRTVGVTGTNGKSTVVDLVSRIAVAAGARVGTFGTLAYSLPERRETAVRTTPEATELAPLLAELVAQGGTVAALEVSSHALAQDRVAGLELDVAVWTNLTRDHLDFHGTMEHYLAAKARLAELLRPAPPGRRVLPSDDSALAALRATPRDGDLLFGLDGGADVTARDVRLDATGTSLRLVTPLGDAPLRLPLVGRHNVRNALAAAAAAVQLGWPLVAVVAGLQDAKPVPGRLERVELGAGLTVLVDYAHTPDALEQVLLALREIGADRLVVVFGAGGDKDTGKRAPMGEIVGRLADVPIVTSDNPRSEDPEAIVATVMEGVRRSGNPRALAIPDRREAIAAALAVATPGSIVVIAGKGHETEQIFADRTIAFDDRVVVRELARRRTT